MQRIITLILLFFLVSCHQGNSDKTSYKESQCIDSNASSDGKMIISNVDSNSLEKNDSIPVVYKSILRHIDDIAYLKKSTIEIDYQRIHILYLKVFIELDSLDKLNILTKNNYYQDIYNYANYREVDTISIVLLKKGVVSISNFKTDNNIIIDSNDWLNFYGELRVTENFRILSQTFENYSCNPNTNYSYPSLGYWRFFGTANNILHIDYSDTILALMPVNREGTSIITSWKTYKDKYELISVFDNLIAVSKNSGVRIDKIYNIDQKRKLIVGGTSGGDDGYTWGSLWLGLWEIPRKFKIIFFIKYSGELRPQNSTKEKFDYSINMKELKFELKKSIYHFKVKNYEYSLIDSNIIVQTIKLDSIFNVNRTKEFNNRF